MAKPKTKIAPAHKAARKTAHAAAMEANDAELAALLASLGGVNDDSDDAEGDDAQL